MTRRQGIALASRWLVEAGIAWAALAFLVLAIDPVRLPRPVALLLVVGPLFGCLASPGLLLAMWREPNELWRSRRQSYGCAGALCTLFVLYALHLLTVPRIVLGCLVVAGLVVLRWRAQRAVVAPVSAQPDAAPNRAAASAAPAVPTIGAVSPAPQLVQRIGRGGR